MPKIQQRFASFFYETAVNDIKIKFGFEIFRLREFNSANFRPLEFSISRVLGSKFIYLKALSI